jgi:hypothetical protein
MPPAGALMDDFWYFSRGGAVSHPRFLEGSLGFVVVLCSAVFDSFLSAHFKGVFVSML